MRKLTLREEKRVLNSVLRKVAKGYETGSSRLVVDFGIDKVVKVAFNDNGLKQNLLEIDTFLTAERQDYLATIYAYGSNVIIMERVETIGELECISAFYELEELAENDSYFEKCLEIAEYLNDINGFTEDNMQIGIGVNGDFKAYDYGFKAEIGARNQMGNMRDYGTDEIKGELYSLLDYLECE